MAERTDAVASLPGDDVPWAIHRWNFWALATEAALYITGMGIMGPMALIPFLFQRTGIDQSWLGLFTISNMIIAVGTPLGAAWAGGLRHKLPYCVRMGFFQRLSFALLPLGVMFFFDRPNVLLAVVVAAWVSSHFFCGLSMPAYQAIVSSGVRESWWGRRMSVQNALASTGALTASGAVWAINRHCDVPTNYIVLGWSAIGVLYVSLFIVTRIREVPLDAAKSYGRESFTAALRRSAAVLRHDQRVRWVVAARVFRSAGFLLGTYMTAVFIERCGLEDRQMWLPIVLGTLPQIVNNLIAGRFVDRYGVKAAMVISAIFVVFNGVYIMHCHTVPAFVLLYICAGFGGALLMNAWTPLIMKLAPPEHRPAYFTTVTLGAAPGSVLVMVIGILLVQYSGFDHVFYMSIAGGAIAALLFLFKVPRL